MDFTILESTLPARDYIATFQLAPISDGDRCWISWSAEFEADDPAGVSDRLRQYVFRPGFDGLSRMLAG